jgi:hypothetical protein
LPITFLEPQPPVYGQLEKDTFLKGKIAVGEFKYNAAHKGLAPLYTYTNLAVADALRKAGYLASNAEKAPYLLSGVIKDVQPPRCLFANCDTGSAVEYTLMDTKKDEVAYHELVVVPYTYDIPFMGGDEVMILQQGYGGAIGNNIAHLLHVLNQKTKSDLQGN